MCAGAVRLRGKKNACCKCWHGREGGWISCPRDTLSHKRGAVGEGLHEAGALEAARSGHAAPPQRAERGGRPAAIATPRAGAVLIVDI
eukprot:2239775-Alexandrium_andersonii.AAC.1